MTPPFHYSPSLSLSPFFSWRGQKPIWHSLSIHLSMRRTSNDHLTESCILSSFSKTHPMRRRKDVTVIFFPNWSCSQVELGAHFLMNPAVSSEIEQSLGLWKVVETGLIKSDLELCCFCCLLGSLVLLLFSRERQEILFFVLFSLATTALAAPLPLLVSSS